jgi:hypothetical protein
MKFPTVPYASILIACQEVIAFIPVARLYFGLGKTFGLNFSGSGLKNGNWKVGAVLYALYRPKPTPTGVP